jgi:hypothetical protein
MMQRASSVVNSINVHRGKLIWRDAAVSSFDKVVGNFKNMNRAL